MFMSRGWEHRRPGGKHDGPPLNFEVKLVGLFDTFFYPLHPELKPGRSLLIAHVQMFANRFLNLRSYSWVSRVFFAKENNWPLSARYYSGPLLVPSIQIQKHMILIDFGYTSMCTPDV